MTVFIIINVYDADMYKSAEKYLTKMKERNKKKIFCFYNNKPVLNKLYIINIKQTISVSRG